MQDRIEMDCRIDAKPEGSRIVVMIAGRLSSDSLEELQHVLRSVQSDFALDLSNLASADDQGVEALRALRRDGVEIRSASPFVQLLLQEEPGANADNATPD